MTDQSLIALGGNLSHNGEPPEVTIRAAAAALADEGLHVRRLSRMWRTPCFPAGAGPDYANAAAVISPEQTMGPQTVLEALHRVEARFGRARMGRWTGRTLDIDLLASGDSILPDAQTQTRWRNLSGEEQALKAPDRLILPHPRMQDRAFVLVPLAEVAPDWVHPLLGYSVRQMLDALPQADRDAVKLL